MRSVLERRADCHRFAMVQGIGFEACASHVARRAVLKHFCNSLLLVVKAYVIRPNRIPINSFAGVEVLHSNFVADDI